ncbi:MAG TPA: PAS domain S-box protein [Chitinophagaceae bacterium]|nr:PAS domain S-box protein [Chitinophagaceae bacterium]
MSGIVSTGTMVESFASLANAMPQLVWIAEANGSVFYYNDRITEFKGAERLSNGHWKWQGLLHPEDQSKTERAWQKALAEESVYEMEHRIMIHSGEYRWYLSRAFPQKDEEGRVTRWYGTATDVHEQKKAQELLRLSEAEFRAIFEITTVGMAQADAKGKLLRVNNALAELIGYTRSEIEGRYFSEFMYPEDRDADLEKFQKLTTGAEKRYFSEKRYIRKDGQHIWVIVSAISVFDEKGVFKNTVAVIQDITYRKKIEQALEKLATHLKIATDSAGAATWYYDLVNNKLEWSDLHKKLWGVPVEKQDLKYEDWLSPIHPEDKDEVLSRLKYAADNHATYEAQYRIIKGEGTIWVQSYGQFIYNGKNETTAVTGISVDITEKKKKEKELLVVKEQLELTLKNVPAGIMLMNKNGEIVFANEKAAWFMNVADARDLMDEKDISGLHEIGKKYFRVYDLNGREMDKSSSPAARALSTGATNEEVFKIEFTNGEKPRWIVYSCNPLLDEQGMAIMVLTTITDITIQKTAEQQIRQSEEQLRFLAESIPQLVWMAGETGECEYKTRRWFEYSGLSQEDDDILGKIIHPDDKSRIDSLWTESLVSTKPFRDEARLRNRNGEYRWHALSGEPIVNADGKVFKWIGVFTDIDEQKTSAEKLESLVTLRTKELQRSNEDLQQFAHVASHDLKEPLRKIKIFGSRLKDEFDSSLPEKAKIYLEKIEGAVNRMGTMVDGVLQYSSLNASAQVPERVDLNGVLDSIKSDLEISIQQSGAIIDHDDLPVIEGAPVLIYQLFYNLVNNSLKFHRKAVQPVIIIRSELLGPEDNPVIKLTFEDNGIGFEMEYAESIFNSFSRLHPKDRYEGTGLGLALCKKIVERHHGTIEAWGEIDKGAKFIVCLPISQWGHMI